MEGRPVADVPDKVDEAIASAEQVIHLPPPRVIRIDSTGRHFAFSLPEDVTDSELFEIVGWLSTGYRMEQAHKRQVRQPGGKLWVPPGGKPALVRPT